MAEDQTQVKDNASRSYILEFSALPAELAGKVTGGFNDNKLYLNLNMAYNTKVSNSVVVDSDAKHLVRLLEQWVQKLELKGLSLQQSSFVESVEL